MRTALKIVSGIVLGLSLCAAAVSLLALGKAADAAINLGIALGVFLSAGIVWLLVDIANALDPQAEKPAANPSNLLGQYSSREEAEERLKELRGKFRNTP